MKFNSIREYFYKMYNALYSLILVPLIAFILLYLQVDNGNLVAYYKEDESTSLLLLIIVVSGVVADILIGFIFFNNRLKRIRRVESFGERLSKYYRLTVVRFLIGVIGLLMLVGGFFLTESQVFTILFVISLGLHSILWPLPSKVCRDLRLRGDERLMILYKKEKLY